MINHLYDQFKHWSYVNQQSKNCIYLYSDPHFGDEEMKYLRANYVGDEEQIKRINSKVSHNDTIIFLGDIGDINCIKKIHGYKILIMGNHERGASNYTGVFNEVYEGPVMISDRIMLSHEPLDLPPCIFNIHGHDHTLLYHEDRHLNLCAEHINYTPVSLNKLIKDGLLKDTESIHRITIDHATERKLAKKLTIQ